MDDTRQERRQERNNNVSMQRRTIESSINKSKANANRINNFGLKLGVKRHNRQQNETTLKLSTES